MMSDSPDARQRFGTAESPHDQDVRRRLATLLAVGLLAACGGGNGDGGEDTGGTEPPTGPAPTGTIGDTTEDEPGETETDE